MKSLSTTTVFNDYFLNNLKNKTASLFISDMINTQILESISQTSLINVRGLSSQLIEMINSHLENESFIENFKLTKKTFQDVWFLSCFAGSINSSVDIAWELHLINGLIEFVDFFDVQNNQNNQNNIFIMDNLDLKKIRKDVELTVLCEVNGEFSIKTSFNQKKASNYCVNQLSQLQCAN